MVCSNLNSFQALISFIIELMGIIFFIQGRGAFKVKGIFYMITHGITSFRASDFVLAWDTKNIFVSVFLVLI